MLHKVWGTYGLVPITDRDRKEILTILKHFRCKGGYYLDVPKEVVLERNTNRGRNTFLERRLGELDFLYENFYAFVEIVEKSVEICAVREKSLQGRVKFLLDDCEGLKIEKKSLVG
jgi:thymidylate kinase